ncbi:MAG: dihydroorotate dehydrogenase electron transfer subunit [Bacteroidales bacterium]|nr:dihydroorotate dehydrogenase electron transfer subunit [Bacteroidales bacterium]
MKQVFTIEKNEPVAFKTWNLVLKSADPDYLFSGEFVDIAIPGFYLRRPVSVCDCSKGRITLYYKVVGEGTKVLSCMAPGDELELLTDLGRGFDASLCAKSALLVAGGLGSAPLYPLAKELKALGRRVTAVLGFNNASEIVLEKEYRALCDEVAVATMDGSAGIKGLVTDAISVLNPGFDCFYTCGPLVMMKAVCNALPGKGQLSMEERMGCGSGFCYGCSIMTKSGPKRVCKDGPVFDKEDIIW